MEQIVLNRIHDLLIYRQWYRSNRWALWPEIRREHEVELRALVRLARQARRQTEADTVWRVGARPGAGWTEPELREAWGR